MAKTALERAADAVGGIPSLALKLNVTRQALYQWRRVPADRVLLIEGLTGVSRHELRPDLYPLPEAERPAA